MISQGHRAGEVPRMIRQLGGLKACAKLWRGLKNGEHTDVDAQNDDAYPRNLAALVGDVLPDTGDRALVMTRLARYSGKRVDIERAIKLPALSDNVMSDFWTELEAFVSAFAAKTAGA